MSKWIDAEKELKELKNMKVEGEVFTTAVNFAIKVIEDAPSIDIVRCKECKFADAYKTISGEWRFYCMESGVGGRKNDDFCSYGEREGE